MEPPRLPSLGTDTVSLCKHSLPNADMLYIHGRERMNIGGLRYSSFKIDVLEDVYQIQTKFAFQIMFLKFCILDLCF